MISEKIDVEKLRQTLIDYYGTAMFAGFSMAIVDLSNIEVASKDELIEMAKNNGIDLNDYIIKEK